MADESLTAEIVERKLAYFSGLIDGEAHVAMKQQKKIRKDGSFYIVPTITVGMTCEKTIRNLHKFFGGAYWTTQGNYTGCKQLYWWSIVGIWAKEVANRLIPYSVTKEDALKSLLAFEPLDGATRFRSAEGNYLKFPKEIIAAVAVEYRMLRDNAHALSRKRIERGALEDLSIKYKISKTTIISIVNREKQRIYNKRKGRDRGDLGLFLNFK